MKNKAFTLVEVMIIIAIIALLAAIAYPNLILAKCNADYRVTGEVPEGCQGAVHLHDDR